MNGVKQLWVQSMRAAGRSRRTIKERERIVEASGLDPVTCTVYDVEEWLAAHPHWSPATRRAYTDALRSFFGWMHARGLRTDDPTAHLAPIRVPRGRPRPVTTAQLRLLLARAHRKRLRGYLLLGAYAGLRVAEIANVRGEDISDGWITVRGKGGSVSRLPLHPLLEEYAETMPRDGMWFPNYQGTGSVSSGNVSRVVSDHMRRCGVPATAHCLRHWFGTELVAEGTQMRVVQEGMRHANLQNTQVYTGVAPEKVRQAICALPAVA